MSSHQIAGLYIENAYKQCLKALIPQNDKLTDTYTKQNQDEFTNCLARYVDSYRSAQKGFYTKTEQ